MYSCESKTDTVHTLLSVWEVMPLAFKSQELFQGQASQALRCDDHYSSYLSPPHQRRLSIILHTPFWSSNLPRVSTSGRDEATG